MSNNNDEIISSLTPPGADRKSGVDYEIITVNIEMRKASSKEGDEDVDDDEQTVKVCLYLHDRRLADAPATLVSSETVKLSAKKDLPTLILRPDFTKINPQKKRMVEPSMYVSLDVAAGTVTYDDGGSPIFDVKLGDDVTLKIKA